VLEVWRDLAQRNEFIVFVVGLAVNKRLQAAFHVHGGSRRINPFGCDEGQRGERPRGDEAEAKTEKDESDTMLPAQRPGRCVGLGGHTPE